MKDSSHTALLTAAIVLVAAFFVLLIVSFCPREPDEFPSFTEGDRRR